MPGRVEAAEQSAHTGPRNPVHRDAVFFQVAQHTDMRETQSAAATQSYTDSWPGGLRLGIRRKEANKGEEEKGPFPEGPVEIKHGHTPESACILDAEVRSLLQ